MITAVHILPESEEYCLSYVLPVQVSSRNPDINVIAKNVKVIHYDMSYYDIKRKNSNNLSHGAGSVV
jgi:hypothetical protein